MVANPARGQVNREKSKKKSFFPVPVRACEFGLARGRPTSASSFSTLRLNLVLCQLTGLLPLSATAS